MVYVFELQIKLSFAWITVFNNSTNEINKKIKRKLIVFTILNMLYDKYAAHSVC